MTISVEVQGSYLKVTRWLPNLTPPPKGGKREKIQTFSKAARRRLIHFLARIKRKGIRATFITLTFAGFPSGKEAKAALKRFIMRIRRKHEHVSGIWRMEKQSRGSIHFHLLLYNLPYYPQAALQDDWTACTREARSIVDIRLVRGTRSIAAYISKYIAKVSEPEEVTYLEHDAYQHASEKGDGDGRYWGWINRDNLPMDEAATADILDRDMARYLSWAVDKLSRGKAYTRGRTYILLSLDAYEVFYYCVSQCNGFISPSCEV